SGDASGATLLDTRLRATRDWLGRAPPETVSIQIMGSRSEDQLDRQLRALARQLESEQLFVFRTRAGERPSMTVLYGTFATRDEARAALASLPPPIRNFSPHLRTVQGVRAEIAASGS
ncbi:MAG: SPOR domain-containing protein, partial [Proteobacteria bacterium]|nr:SPOR domain-containing protein [Burkholderiales bacterium]